MPSTSAPCRRPPPRAVDFRPGALPKQHTRTSQLAPPRAINVEEMISYMEDDEVIEVTPKAVRLHKARAFVATTWRARKP